MKDIINSFKAHLYERTSNPLVGAFIFYWMICNYKFIILLLDGKLKANEKFNEISKLYENDTYNIFNIIELPLNGLLIPIIITLGYILIFPFISNLIHKAWIWHQNELKKISNGKVLTKKEFGDLQRRFTELELSFDDTFSKKDNEITQLKKLIIEKDDLNLKIDKEIQKYKTKENEYVQFSNERLKLLSKISELENQIQEKLGEVKLVNLDKEKTEQKLQSKIKELVKYEEHAKKYDKVYIELKELKAQNNELLKTKKYINSSNKMQEELGYSTNEIDILKLIGNSDGLYSDVIQTSLKLHKVIIETGCRKLLSTNLITEKEYQGNYIITKEGELFLLNNNLI